MHMMYQRMCHSGREQREFVEVSAFEGRFAWEHAPDQFRSAC